MAPGSAAGTLAPQVVEAAAAKKAPKKPTIANFEPPMKVIVRRHAHTSGRLLNAAALLSVCCSLSVCAACYGCGAGDGMPESHHCSHSDSALAWFACCVCAVCRRRSRTTVSACCRGGTELRRSLLYWLSLRPCSHHCSINCFIAPRHCLANPPFFSFAHSAIVVAAHGVAIADHDHAGCTPVAIAIHCCSASACVMRTGHDAQLVSEPTAPQSLISRTSWPCAVPVTR